MTCLPEDKNPCQGLSIWDVFKAEWQRKGRGGSRALRLMLCLSWPVAMSPKCLFIPHTAEGVLENPMLLILAEELEPNCSPGRGQQGTESSLPNEKHWCVFVSKDAGIS